MQFGILGTFEVSRGRAVLTPSAPKLRQVLALLTVQANAVVPTRLLIDELWEDRSPVSSATTLQTYIYQLRKLLSLREPEATGRPDEPDQHTAALHTRPGGYLLHLPDGALDARRFEQMAAKGREEMGRNRIAEAADTLREALALWRGPALSDLEYGPVLHAEIIRLHEMRNSVTEMRMDADLSLGRHRQLISELTAMTARDQTHEGLHARLMLVLYRAGRRSEALRIFKRLRTALAEELGLEPGPAVQRLHRGILAGDPELDMQEEAQRVQVAPPAPAVPAQLPADIAFVGREKELQSVRGCLLGGTGVAPTAVVVGLPGAGISAFCTHAANSVREHFPDGQFWARLTTPHGRRIDRVKILDGFLRAIGHADVPAGTDVAERSALFRSWCANRRVLVVLDDVSDAADLNDLMPGGAGCATLVGSRRRLCRSGVTATVDLPPLSEAESVSFLTLAVGADRLRGDDVAVHQLVQLCGGLPAALRAVANELVLRPHWCVDELLARAADDQHRRRWLCSSGLDVWRSVMGRFHMLAAPHRVIVQDLVRQGAPDVTAAGAAAMVGTVTHLAESALERCAELRLMDVDRPTGGAAKEFRYRLHPFVRLVTGTFIVKPEPVRSVSRPPQAA
jgi:DNA-binding SARP family transcriptional activator